MKLTSFFTIASFLFLLKLVSCGSDSTREQEQPTPSSDSVDHLSEQQLSRPTVSTGWSISSTGEGGAVPGDIDEEELIGRYGKENVLRGEMPLGEGEMMEATILFPNDPMRRLEIAWYDPTEEIGPQRIALRGEESRWSVTPGLRLGMSLDSLVALNGRTISFLGFDWDYGGTVISWNGGEVWNIDLPNGGIIVRLRPDTDDYEKLSEEERMQISGDHELRSDDPLFKRLRLRIFEILVDL